MFKSKPMFVVYFEIENNENLTCPFKTWYDADVIKQKLLSLNKFSPEMKDKISNIQIFIDDKLIEDPD